MLYFSSPAIRKAGKQKMYVYLYKFILNFKLCDSYALKALKGILFLWYDRRRHQQQASRVVMLMNK